VPALFSLHSKATIEALAEAISPLLAKKTAASKFIRNDFIEFSLL
jgi:hypothetical protein